MVFLNKYLKSPTLLTRFTITLTDSAHNLGFIFDSSLSKEISSLSSACNYRIRDLRHIGHTLDLKTVSVIATSLVHSKVDYYNCQLKHIAKTNTSSPTSLLSQNIPFQHLIPTLTFYPAWTDHIDLYPNSDVNHVLRTGEYIRSLQFTCFYGRHINVNFTYLLKQLSLPESFKIQLKTSTCSIFSTIITFPKF